mgnify:FL=1|tara:strand:+ start:988 stop:1191 length:204 start_codon:yes stop_codon:yes gene_type:complete
MKKIAAALVLAFVLTGCANIQPASYVVDRACKLEGARALLAKETLDKAVYPHRVTVECNAFADEEVE